MCVLENTQAKLNRRRNLNFDDAANKVSKGSEKHIMEI